GDGGGGGGQRRGGDVPVPDRQGDGLRWLRDLHDEPHAPAPRDEFGYGVPAPADDGERRDARHGQQCGDPGRGRGRQDRHGAARGGQHGYAVRLVHRLGAAHGYGHRAGRGGRGRGGRLGEPRRHLGRRQRGPRRQVGD